MSLVLVAVVAYSAIALIGARMVGGHFAWVFMAASKRAYPYINRYRHEPDIGNWVAGAICGLAAGACWPALVLLLIRLPTVGAERTALLERQRKRIAELEREAGIR